MKSYFSEKMEPTLGESRSELELSLGNTPAAMISAEPSLARDDDDDDDGDDDLPRVDMDELLDDFDEMTMEDDA